MKKLGIYTITTIIATTVLVFITAAIAGITDNFYYFFDDAGCTIGAVVVGMIGTWIIGVIYYAAVKITKKLNEKEMKRKIDEYNYIVEMISKKLGL